MGWSAESNHTWHKKCTSSCGGWHQTMVGMQINNGWNRNIADDDWSSDDLEEFDSNDL